MIAALLSLSVLGLGIGYLLGIAAKYFKVEGDPLAAELEAMLPNTNCGQCGFPGCSAAATALSSGSADLALCPPGGKALVEALAEKLGVSANLGGMKESVALMAVIDEATCTGCTKCYKICPTDAILGAQRQLHVVIRDACIGCEKCVEKCPDNCISMREVPTTLQTWRWHKPELCA